MLVLHWVAGEQGHGLNEFSNPSNGSYCDFTKERGKVREQTISYFQFVKFGANSCEREFAQVSYCKVEEISA